MTAGGALNWATDGRVWPNREASSFVRAAGLTWHVQQMGAGPSILLIHGTGASTHSWRHLMPLLARDHHCVAIDLPGHGFTSAPPSWQLSLPGMAQGIAALLDELKVVPEVVVGHSAGAAIAAQMCLRDGTYRPSVISINGAFMPFDGLSGLLFPSMAKFMAATTLCSKLFAWRAADRRTVEQLISNTGSSLDAQGIDLYAMLVRNPVHVQSALGMMADWNLAHLSRQLPRASVALHLIAGANDRTVRPDHSRQLQARVPGATFTLMRGVGHLAHEERAGDVARLIQELIQQPVEECIGEPMQHRTSPSELA
ncbi:alpha/beta fold hydrolase [soil metagenome]